ncbi:MAG: PKD domain-containing protein [Candidatus Bathyarchaeia archaeon]
MNKALWIFLCVISLVMVGVLWITGHSYGVKAQGNGIIVEDADYIVVNSTEYSADLANITKDVTPRIIIEYADYVSVKTAEYSEDLINTAKTVAPRIVLEYGEFISKMDLYKPEGLNQVAKIVSPRITVEYADSICDLSLQGSSTLNQVVTTVGSRIAVEYADAIITVDLQRPLFLPPAIKNLTAYQTNIAPTVGCVVISYEVIDSRQTVTVNFQYWSGSQWIDCITTTGEGIVHIGRNTGTWNAKTDYNGYYTTNMKIRVIADNSEATNNIAISGSPAFTLDTQDPPSPSLLSPLKNTLINKTTPTLDWSDVSDPSGVRYFLELDDDPNFVSPLLAKTWLTSSQYTISSQEALKDGTYYWRVKAVDGMGNEGNWASSEFEVDVTPPKADAGSDQIVNEDTPITFDGSRSSDKNGIASYTWILPNQKTLNGMITNYTFETPGTYTITLMVTDYAGNYATDSIVITVLDITKPSAKATYTVTYQIIMWTVTFDASASTDNVGIVSYEWDFGDGTTATGQTTYHTYAKAGVYNVTLTVRDEAGNVNADSVIVTIVVSTSPWRMSAFLAFTTIFGLLTTLIISLKKRRQIKE